MATFQEANWTSHDEPTFNRIRELTEELGSLLDGAFGVTADASHPLRVETEEEAETFFLTARRGLVMTLLAQETHDHRLDDCGDDVNHASELWDAVWNAYFVNDGQDRVNSLNTVLAAHNEEWAHEEEGEDG